MFTPVPVFTFVTAPVESTLIVSLPACPLILVTPLSLIKLTVSSPLPLFSVVTVAALVLLIVKVLPPLPSEIFNAARPL